MRKIQRRSIKTGNFMQGILFFLFTIGSIVCLIVYLWIFKYIDESMLAIEIQNTTARELKNEIDDLKILLEEQIIIIEKLKDISHHN